MRGTGYAGEGDVLTAGLVGALLTAYPDTTFTEMFCPDWKNDAVLLSHMGEMNLSLCRWKPVLSDCKFQYNASGDTTAAYGCLRGGEAVLVNLAPAKEGFRLILAPVTMLDAGLEFGAYRHEMQGFLQPPMPLPRFLEAYSTLGGTHHSALVYHAPLPSLAAFGRFMGFDVQVLRGE